MTTIKPYMNTDIDINDLFPYEDERFTIKISSDLYYEVVKRLDKNRVVSDMIRSLFRRYEEIRDISLVEVKEDIFTEEELKCLVPFIADKEMPLHEACTGVILQEFLKEENVEGDKMCESYNVLKGELIFKCGKLPAAQADALYLFCRDNKI